MVSMGKKKPAKPLYSPAQILAIREMAELSQREAADRIGVSARSWQSWERGESIPTIPMQILIRMLSEGHL